MFHIYMDCGCIVVRTHLLADMHQWCSIKKVMARPIFFLITKSGG